MSPATIIVLLIVAAVFAAIVISGIKKRKSGNTGCSCGCSGCALKGSCHSTDE